MSFLASCESAHQGAGWRTGRRIVGEFGKLLIIFGMVLLVVGLLVLALGRTHLPLGHLPGDIEYQGKNVSFYFPLMTCLLLSAVVSAIYYFIKHCRH
jgi:phosphatidylglycerophosphate synthase